MLFKGQENRLFYVQNLDLERESISRMTIYQLDDSDNIARRLLLRKPPPGNRKNGHLVKGFVRRFNPDGETEFEPFVQKQIKRLEDPKLFAENNRDPRAMTIKDLRNQIAYKEMVGQTTRLEQVRMHHKMAYPFCCVRGCFNRCANRYPFWQSGLLCRAGLLHFFSVLCIGDYLLQPLKD